MRGRWADNAYWHRDDPEPERPAQFTSHELLAQVRAEQGINALIDEIADIVNDRQAEWRRHAACSGLGTDNFFPMQGGISYLQAEAAKAVCSQCPVTAECDEYATAHHIRHGVWGGKAGRNRNRGTWDRGAA